ncbi:secreted protein containing duf1501 : Uncharacterized protein OS=Singulisphaera acidiphila (strain ATCC BAA-1392 / DSM 18658 / VKM B-2454 / MOB10) GN=Sinac_5270 PE=4 SV=1: DUF1501: DUF1501 [Gemmataceae bacterium]|nr:secreted protein containing duf1501 : Uncharacterized protein OS=Singulisphaera acidiphila (strain ATCC BAA-1392 / DSM 18658 / VKM B-2454 / MOB10) GN=Sinac_5270 PE=4 SV=1: DUF1501: DUF1501 [Gemmataceae bacterium]VTU01617.1 secreted protein containing duf1501 : Uncharacterized protein OS=Singulisphaera acidiphila (strain ATCC BAA-1392 / DSM 18658 / VKM B-2454 / MOB10) GN=Sinac_5270 PE=4 SV=1: DUF1501: DUF1501 [Gemmataceae bacterium]
MTTPTRREFLAATAAATVLPALGTARTPRSLGKAKSCIFINMIGGPPHLDTFDPKPNAPAEYRGPFGAIQTKTPGVHLSELFPKLATLTDKFAMVRSMHHTAPPVHEAGLQLLNTGRLFRDGPEWPSVGCVMMHLKGDTQRTMFPPRHFVCPVPHVETGIRIGQGFGPGFLGERVPWYGGVGWTDEFFAIGDLRKHFDLDPRYGMSAFGQNCSAQVQDEAQFHLGRFVTINQFSTVFDEPSWDCHADGGSLRTDLSDIRDTVAPSFDAALAALLTDLDERGLLDTTLVVATGEFGRTPLLNANGGRDHWAGAWTALVAGGGVQGGRVIGRTDSRGTEPTDRPVTPEDLVASVFHALGVPHDATIPGPDGKPVAVYPAAPVLELF